MSNSCADKTAQDAHRTLRCAEGSVADAKRSTGNVHGEDHGSHCTAQCVNVMEEVFNGREEDFNDHTQRPKRATQMTVRSTQPLIRDVYRDTLEE
jgi:hypothetical protein